MKFDKIKYVHFVGIGGIGMSALARYFNFLGKKVSGYDKTSTDLTRELEAEGMVVYHEENVLLIPRCIREDVLSEENLFIFTPAIPSDHAELVYLKEEGAVLHKRAAILGFISEDLPTVAIGGTHGKTTTTSLLTFICKTAGLPFISFVGGINENFNSNLVIQGDPEFMITEADEYDRSFLKLHPTYAILTSMDADHLDIYQSPDAMTESFKLFAGLVGEKGLLLLQHKLNKKIGYQKHLTYGLTNDADFRAEQVTFENAHFQFDFKGKGQHIEGIHLSLPGYHNLENAVAATAMALNLGVQKEAIKEALSTYKGVKRRFEYHINNKDLIYIDDYAHHPEEINAVVSSLRKMYPGKKITGIFQPHLFSRTRDLAEGFARSLEKLDELFLLDIYPAREKPMPGISSAWLLEQVDLENKQTCHKNDLMEKLEKTRPEILLTIGAGDIDQLVKVIKKHYSR
jgi:UDP-N-acetylmuramate--alanine ligase